MEEIVDCARYGELEEIQKLLAEEKQASGVAEGFESKAHTITNENGNTALHMAAANGHIGKKTIRGGERREEFYHPYLYLRQLVFGVWFVFILILNCNTCVFFSIFYFI